MNNHGWGLREMIIYMCIFAIILLFVAFSINALYKRIDRDSKNRPKETVIVEPVEEKPKVEPEVKPRAVDYSYYHDLENKVYEATLKYLKDYPTIIDDDILKVTSDSLVNLGYIDELYNDIKSEKCTGFSNVYTDDVTKNYVVRSYITCDNYTSEGY